MKTRIFVDKNYKAIYNSGKTIRIALNPDLPIQKLDYPEFWDVKISSWCNGSCPYCYQKNTIDGTHASHVLDKIDQVFGSMNENQRPFQVALAGVEHPEFVEVLKKFHDLGITPNYTTNGKFTSPKLLQATQNYCGGVAVTCHAHLRQHWQCAVETYLLHGIKTNLHILVHDRASIDEFIKIYNSFAIDEIAYFVLLPVINQGFASGYSIDHDYLFDAVKQVNSEQIAFGAMFYPELVKRDMQIMLYEPEIMSRYIDLVTMTQHNSSFEESR